jgi:hypothetical protein
MINWDELTERIIFTVNYFSVNDSSPASSKGEAAAYGAAFHFIPK